MADSSTSTDSVTITFEKNAIPKLVDVGVLIEDRDSLNEFLKKNKEDDSDLTIGIGEPDVFDACVNDRLRRIGKGQYNEVFEVNTKYVLRVTLPTTGEYHVGKEIDGLRLQHSLSDCANIARIYAFGLMRVRKEDTVYKAAFAIMDNLNGDNLFHFIRKQNSKNQYHPDRYTKIHNKFIKSIMEKLITALQCIDKKGYCHRDMKAENVMIKNKDDITSVELIDFGFMKECNETNIRLDESISNSIMGTPGYIHSNSVSSLKAYTRGVDMWALGIILIELLGGLDLTDSASEIQLVCIKKETERNVCPEYYTEVYRVYTIIIGKYPEFRDLLKALLGKHRAGKSFWGSTPKAAEPDAFPTNTNQATTPTYDNLLAILRRIPVQGGRRKNVRNSRVGKRTSRKITRKNIKLTKRETMKRK